MSRPSTERATPTRDRIRLLLIQSEADDPSRLQSVLKEIYGERLELERVATAAEGQEALLQGAHDVCLLDARVRVELARDRAEEGRRLPVVLLVEGAVDDPARLAAETGAVDVVSRQEITPALLERVIRYAVERARLDTVLRVSEARFRSLIEHNPHAVYGIDHVDGTFIAVNPAVEALTGYDAIELLGTSFRKVIHADSEREAKEVFARAASGEPTAYDIAIRHRDGHRVEIHGVSVPVMVRGEVAAIYGTAEDVTERRVLESRLLQSQRLEAVGRLAGGVAHDFNNVLTVVQGNAQLLLLDVEDEAMRGNVEEIELAARRARDLVRQLLAFSRQQVLQPKVVDLRAVVRGMEGMLRRLIGEHIELEISSQTGIWNVRADPGHLNQVVMNLVVNARDAMPEGGRLTIRLENAEIDEAEAGSYPYQVRAGRYVQLAVQDTGAGMDEETVSRLWEPFFTTKGERGTGLGLATVYGIIKQSEGYIWVDSEPGRGTTFRIYLPWVEEDATVAGSQDAAPAPPADAGELTVLLCEDEDAVRRMVRRALDRHGFRVVEACSADQAMEVADSFEGTIDLLLSDVVMPGMGGAELASRLRETRPGIRVLLMSGYARDHVAGQHAPGLDLPFIQKPFTPSELVERIGEVVGE